MDIDQFCTEIFLLHMYIYEKKRDRFCQRINSNLHLNTFSSKELIALQKNEKRYLIFSFKNKYAYKFHASMIKAKLKISGKKKEVEK